MILEQPQSTFCPNAAKEHSIVFFKLSFVHFLKDFSSKNIIDDFEITKFSKH